MFVMHRYLVSRLFFMGKAQGTRGQGCVATFMLGSLWVSLAVGKERSCVFHIF